MPTLSHLPTALQNLLSQSASLAGLESGFLLRRSKLSPELFVQTLVLGWLANLRLLFNNLPRPPHSPGPTFLLKL